VRIISLGELLWDVFNQREFLGGAPLNFSITAQRLGNTVALLTAVGADARGSRALEEMEKLGLATEFVQTVSERPTGTAIVVTDRSGNISYAIERPAAFDRVQSDDSLLARLADLHPEWIYFGTLAQTYALNGQLLHQLVQRVEGVKCFYDLNLREGHWNLALVQHLSGMATVLKLNEAEAELLSQMTIEPEKFSLERFCQYWSGAYGVRTICITLGSAGCAIFTDDTLRFFGGFSVEVTDTVGAGDAFAAAFLHGYHRAWPIERIARFANALGSIVASKAGPTPSWPVEDCLAVASISLNELAS